jgi:pantothenate kinase
MLVSRHWLIFQDGFHHPKSTLGAFSDPANAFLRRGAPFTYDAEAFVAAVKYLRASKVTADHDAALDILWPSFDRATQDPVSDDIVIPSTTKVVILEGNYVLLNQSPWNQIASLVQDRYVHRINDLS